MDRFKIYFSRLYNRNDVPFVELPIGELKKAHKIKGLFHGLDGFDDIEKNDTLESICKEKVFVLVYGEDFLISPHIDIVFNVLYFLIGNNNRHGMPIFESGIYEFSNYQEAGDYVSLWSLI